MASETKIGELQAQVDRLKFELEGIIYFADGFACYYRDSPSGKALREYINGARSAIAALSAPEKAGEVET